MKKIKIKPITIIMLSFLFTIIIGTILLKLPISLQDGKLITWMDSFFLSTSAICVTGLSPVTNLANTLSVFGKVVLALLIQIGGLGCITVAAFFFLMVGAKMGLSERYLLKEALNQDKVSNILKLLKSIIKITLTIELVGAIVNFFVFINYYDVGSAIGISIFHSISAFNNAGFDIIGDSSLIGYSDNILLNINTIVLIVLGGLGFIVIRDLIKNKFNFKKLTIHSKIVLVMTSSLIIVGTILLKISNGNDISWLESLFLSITSRTAGFTTINCSILNGASILIICVLMLIGASPSSTGGGIKTTTFYTMIKSLISFSKGKQTIVNNRKVAEVSKLKAFTLFFVATSMIVISTIMISLIEQGNDLMTLDKLIFESTSAFGTVGLSMGITPYLKVGSKLVLCVLMFFGRLGPITIMGMWNTSWNKPNVNNVEYLEETIIIG